MPKECDTTINAAVEDCKNSNTQADQQPPTGLRTICRLVDAPSSKSSRRTCRATEDVGSETIDSHLRSHMPLSSHGPALGAPSTWSLLLASLLPTFYLQQHRLFHLHSSTFHCRTLPTSSSIDEGQSPVLSCLTTDLRQMPSLDTTGTLTKTTAPTQTLHLRITCGAPAIG